MLSLEQYEFRMECIHYITVAQCYKICLLQIKGSVWHPKITAEKETTEKCVHRHVFLLVFQTSQPQTTQVKLFWNFQPLRVCHISDTFLLVTQTSQLNRETTTVWAIFLSAQNNFPFGWTIKKTKHKDFKNYFKKILGSWNIRSMSMYEALQRNWLQSVAVYEI